MKGKCICVSTHVSIWSPATGLVLIKPAGIKPSLHTLVIRPTRVYPSAGENRHRYFQLLMNGCYTPQTLPVGGEEAREVSPRSLAEALLVKKSVQQYAKNK